MRHQLSVRVRGQTLEHVKYLAKKKNVSQGDVIDELVLESKRKLELSNASLTSKSGGRLVYLMPVEG